MSSGNAIEHQGIVEYISNEVIRVKITSVSACVGCHARGMCSVSDMEDKEILVPDSGGGFRKGDLVEVMMKSSLGTKAVLIGYVYPFLILLTVLLILTGSGVTELKAGILSLGTLVPYYFMVYLFRDKLARTFSFSIRKSV